MRLPSMYPTSHSAGLVTNGVWKVWNSWYIILAVGTRILANAALHIIPVALVQTGFCMCRTTKMRLCPLHFFCLLVSLSIVVLKV